MSEAADRKKIHLRIVTPRGVKIEEEADFLIMRCIDGDTGILPGHSDASVGMGDGILRVWNEGNLQKIAVFDGVAEIKQNTVLIMTTIAQRPDEIDLERAETDRDLIQEKETDLKEQSQHVLLRRALVRIEVRNHEYKSDEEE